MQSPLPARQNLAPIAEELGQQIQALVTGSENGEIEPQETFGTRAFTLILTFFNAVREEGAAFLTNFSAWPQVVAWIDKQIGDPKLNGIWAQIGQQLLIVLGGAFAAGWLADLVLLPFRRRIRRQDPLTLGAKIGALTGWFFVSLVPVVLFLAAALLLMAQSEPTKLVRFFVMTVVYALAVLRLVRLGIRFLLAPNSPALRFLPIADSQAIYVQHWLNAYSLVMVAGYFGVDLAQLVRVPVEAITAFNSIIGLLIVVMTIIIILQKRSFVSSSLRGDLSAAQSGLSLWQSLRLWLARSWHVLAIAYLVIGYIVTMLGAKGGFAIMQRGTILTLLLLFAMRMAFYVISRLRPRLHPKDVAVTFSLFRPVMQTLLRLATWAFGVAGIAAAWGADVEAIVASAWGQRILGSVFTIAATVVIVVLVYEMLQATIERKLNPRDAKGDIVEANARARTLLPMVRNAAMIVLAVIAGMVTLSELGIDTAPLLAGAGVIGVAVGFGSQTLVKDFLTGMFILLEDSLAVGDLVQIGDNKGNVESITMRTVRLRDRDGSLHVLPFSSITSIINRSKTFSYALINLSVGYDSDLQHVMEVMRDEGEKLRADKAFSHLILEPIEVLGVESLGDSAINVSCRIKAAPGKQYDIKRAYLLRIKQRFDAEKIEIPFPTVMQLQRP
ncbi:MAG: mechanosensitive ion channel [Alphaproteobacteria bacterium]|nr:mechanosensitive ion channel [Alphaproteobacteria bacterium]